MPLLLLLPISRDGRDSSTTDGLCGRVTRASLIIVSNEIPKIVCLLPTFSIIRSSNDLVTWTENRRILSLRPAIAQLRHKQTVREGRQEHCQKVTTEANRVWLHRQRSLEFHRSGIELKGMGREGKYSDVNATRWNRLDHEVQRAQKSS